MQDHDSQGNPTTDPQCRHTEAWGPGDNQQLRLSTSSGCSRVYITGLAHPRLDTLPRSVSALSQAWKTLRQLADAFLQLRACPLGLGAIILQPVALAPCVYCPDPLESRGVGGQQATHPRRGRLAEVRVGRAESGWAPPQGELGSHPHTHTAAWHSNSPAWPVGAGEGGWPC